MGSLPRPGARCEAGEAAGHVRAVELRRPVDADARPHRLERGAQVGRAGVGQLGRRAYALRVQVVVVSLS